MKEIWINHHSGLKVSNLGQVWIPRSGKRQEHFTFGSNNGEGYKYVYYKGKSYRVHRLVAECFLPNQNNYVEVNHKDENKENNNVTNLEWCSRKYNVNYGTRTERATKNSDYKSIAEKQSKKVVQMALDGRFVKEWESTAECHRNGFNQSAVSRCCNNKYLIHKKNIYKGFIWKWAV